MYAMVLSVALLTPAADKPPPPVGMVLTSKGAVTLERGGKDKRVGAMDLVLPGDQLTAAADGEATLVFLSDGHREALKPKAQATVAENGCTPADAVQRQAGAKLSEANLANLRSLARSGRGGVRVISMDLPKPYPAVTPLAGTWVATGRPGFSWAPDRRAVSYRVELLTGDGERVLWRATTKEPRLAWPEDEKPLTFGDRDRPFLWRVTARLSGGKEEVLVDGSKFWLPSKQEAEELARVKPLASSKDPADQLLAAATYEAYVDYDDALRLYERLADRLPESVNVQLALARLYKRAGRYDLAEAAQEKAKKLGAVATRE
jgi:tetratricopeptide (TPR) repeat protein